MSSPDHLSPDEALSAVRTARDDMVARVNYKSWTYDLIYSGLVGVASSAFTLSQSLSTPVLGLTTCGFLALTTWWARKTGVKLTGLWPKRARWVAISLGAVMAFLMVGAYSLRHYIEAPWDTPVFFAAGFMAALIASRIWRLVYRSEMGA